MLLYMFQNFSFVGKGLHVHFSTFATTDGDLRLSDLIMAREGLKFPS